MSFAIVDEFIYLLPRINTQIPNNTSVFILNVIAESTREY